MNFLQFKQQYLKSYVTNNRWSEGLEYTLSDDGTYYIVSGIGTCTDTNIVIPSRYESKPVKAIATSAFFLCDNLVSIEIGNGVTSIDSRAFYFCSSLKNVTMGNNIEYVDEFAFERCNLLVYNIYDNALYLGNKENPCIVLMKASSTSITNCTIYEGTKLIVGGAFYDCSSLTSVTIPDSVTRIGDAFSNCELLESVVIGSSVTIIDPYAFFGCNSLTDVYYIGSEEEWAKINIYDYNEQLTNATIHYNWQP